LEISYDADKIDYSTVLDYFFRIHDPTTRNQQGNDRGSSYRSAIFYEDDIQLEAAEAFIEIVDTSGRWPNQVVTTLEEYEEFYLAEEYHQDYLQKSPNGYTCHYVRWPTYITNEIKEPKTLKF
jgi:peptide-methionine (S)-S-oxide reductase